MLENEIAEKCSQVGLSDIYRACTPAEEAAVELALISPSRAEIKAAETTPKILKPKFLVWAMSVALATACPPVLICQSRHGRVTVRGVEV